MAELETDLIMRTDQPMQAVAQLDRALTEVARDAGEAVADELSRAVRIDGSPITTEITESVESADTNVAVGEVDAEVVTETIGEATEAADTAVTIDEVAAGVVTVEIDAAIAAADTTVTIEDAIADAVTEVIEEAVARADTMVEIEAPSADAPGGSDFATNILAGKEATDLLSASTGALSGNLGGLAAKAGPAGAAVAAVGGAVTLFVSGAIEAQDILERFNRTFGDTAPAIEQIDIGGLNISLSALAISLAADDDALRAVATRFGDVAIAGGATRKEAAATAEAIIALAAAASAANPALGSADEAAQGLTTALSRGGKPLLNYGISLTQSEIAARALSNTGKELEADLTTVEKATAGAQLAVEQFGPSLAAKVAFGADQAGTKLKAFSTLIGETIEEMGAPLIEPVLELFKAAGPAIEGTVRIIGIGLRLVTPLVEEFSGAFKILTPVINVVGGALEWVSNKFGGASEAGAGLPPVLDNVTASAGVASESIHKLGEPIVDLADKVKEVADTTQEAQDSIVEGLGGIGSAFDKVAEDGKASMEELRQALLDQFIAESQFFINLKTIVEKGGHDVADAIRAMGPERGAALAAAAAQGTAAEVAQLEFSARQITTLHHDFGEQYANAVAIGFAAGILRAVPIMDTATVQAVMKVKTSGANVLGIRSPSSVFFDYGEKVGLGLAGGIRSSLPVVGAAIGELQRFAVAGGNATVNVAGGSTAPGGAGTSSGQTIVIAEGAVQITTGPVTPGTLPDVEAIVDRAFGRLAQEIGRR